jgi:hypothetical protein
VGSRCTPPCASRPRTAPASNGCCATAGQTELTLAPLELLDRLAALIPLPRRHRHRYAGVFAPCARDPPELEAERVSTPGFAFDHSPPWDPTTPPPDPGYPFDQTLN